MGTISFSELSRAFITLFAIIDITGSIPLILSLKSKGIDINPIKTTCVALGIMIMFLLLGERIMHLFNVDIQSFAVAGSFVLFIMALEMILDVEIFKNNGPKNVGAIVPIAFPLVAGPGSFTAIIALRAEFAFINIFIALILNLLFVFLVLRSTGRIEKLLGKGGIYILRKFFGIILLAIAVKLFTSNLQYLI
ncbi:putative integral membrane protein of the MarC family protein [Bacteroidetes oral taxon 274 str. F0058]|nr:putative integral membrane protein of the MarC family protein [Bacteroidetes oral taxon 274 str. F0058]